MMYIFIIFLFRSTYFESVNRQCQAFNRAERQTYDTLVKSAIEIFQFLKSFCVALDPVVTKVFTNSPLILAIVLTAITDISKHPAQQNGRKGYTR